MSKTILTDAKVTIGGTNVSSLIRSVDVQMSVDDVDLTAMGGTSHAHGAGLRDARMTFEAYQDFTAVSGLDAICSPLLGSSTGATVVVQNVSTSPGVTYTMVGVLFEYHPLNGEVGAASMTPLTFLPAQGSYITRATV